MNWFNHFISKQPRPRTCKLQVAGSLDRKYVVRVDGGDWWDEKDEMIAWCSKQFGHRSKKYNNPRWEQGPFEFRFKNQKDAMLFILRWSE